MKEILDPATRDGAIGEVADPVRRPWDLAARVGRIHVASAPDSTASRTRFAVKEIFYTLQGEGGNTGRPAVFLRFAGCNLWSGHPGDRSAAVCRFCDTDFVGTDGPGGGVFDSTEALAAGVAAAWGDRDPGSERPLVVCTGGEPLLQLDDSLVAAFHDAGFEVAVETNGTMPAPHGIDWLCVSPKAGTTVVLRGGQELKVVFPQEGLDPADFEGWDFERFYLQPKDGPDVANATRRAVDYCLAHPRWRLSLQTHKILGIP